MLNFLAIYGISLLFLTVIDVTWILLVARSFYVNQIGHLMAKVPTLWPAFIFYTLYPLALLVFVVLPELEKKSLTTTVCLKGFFFGFIVYGAYDLTNHATLQDWPLAMTVVDMVWGGFLSSVVSIFTYRLVLLLNLL